MTHNSSMINVDTSSNGRYDIFVNVWQQEPGTKIFAITSPKLVKVGESECSMAGLYVLSTLRRGSAQVMLHGGICPTGESLLEKPIKMFYRGAMPRRPENRREMIYVEGGILTHGMIMAAYRPSSNLRNLPDFTSSPVIGFYVVGPDGSTEYSSSDCLMRLEKSIFPLREHLAPMDITDKLVN